MKRIAYPYYLLALLTTSIAVFFVMKKIDKRGFYHHYFRVIEEVESRNSQAVEALPDLLAGLQSTAFDLPSLLTWLLGLLLLSPQTWRLVISFQLHPLVHIGPPMSGETARWRSCPTRAP